MATVQKNTNLAAWLRASYPVPQSPIMDANGGLSAWQPAVHTVPQSPIMAGNGGMSGLRRGSPGMGAFSSVYNVNGFQILGPYDRLFAAIQGAENTARSNPTDGQSQYGINAWMPARYTVPQSPVLAGNGAGMGHLRPNGKRQRFFGATGNGVNGLGCAGGSGCGGGCGCDGMGDFSMDSITGMFDGVDTTQLMLIGGGLFLAYFLLARGGDYRDEKRAARAAYTGRVRRARKTYKRGYRRGIDAYQEATA